MINLFFPSHIEKLFDFDYRSKNIYIIRYIKIFITDIPLTNLDSFKLIITFLMKQFKKIIEVINILTNYIV